MKLNQTNRTRDSKDIASVTSYFSENEAENLQNGDLHLAQITDFEMGYLENHLAQFQTNRTRDSKDIASVTSYFSEN